MHPINNVLIRPIGGFQPLDADGFLINTARIEKIAPKYLPIIQQVVSKIQEIYEKKWLSIYLKGSVPRGLAIDNVSDLDILVIHKEEIISTDWQNDFKQNITQTYPFLARLDIKHLTYAQLRKNKSMKFLIKTQSVLLEGLDLTAQMASYRISKDCQLILPHLENDLRDAKLQIPSFNAEFEANLPVGAFKILEVKKELLNFNRIAGAVRVVVVFLVSSSVVFSAISVGSK